MGGRSKGTGKPENDEEETGNGFVFTGNVFMFLMEEKHTPHIIIHLLFVSLLEETSCEASFF